MHRYVLTIVVVILCSACRHVEDPSVPVVNVIREVDRAEKRPPDGFEIATREINGSSHPSIIVAVPSRLTIPLPLPRHGALRAVASLDPNSPPTRVRLRVGVSDDRVYERLTDVELTPSGRSWTEVQTDLSAYAGFKWSLFYHPDRVMWHLVLSADAIGGVATRAVWGSPEIVTDTESAKEYSARRQRFR